MSKDFLINKTKYEKKLLKKQKPLKEANIKHKRVKSDINTMAKKMFPETLQQPAVIQQSNNLRKTPITQSYSNKESTTAFTTRFTKQEGKKISRGQYISSHNTFK